VLPGPGVLLGRALGRHEENPYTEARATAADLASPSFARFDVLKTESVLTAEGGRWPLFTANTYRLINPPAGADAATADLTLDAGGAVKGEVLDADGRPLEGVVVHGLVAFRFAKPKTLAAATFTARGLDPAHPRMLL